ncbi:unnamed protein product, partial [marine sediment metagenome]
GKIAAWRAEQAAERTRQRRPDLWQRYVERKAAVQGPAADKPGGES